MSRGRARIVVRLSGNEMMAVQAAADVIQVDVKQLARMGVLREAMDVRNRLIAKMQEEKKARESISKQEDTGAAVQGSGTSGLQGDTLVSRPQDSDDTGTQP